MILEIFAVHDRVAGFYSSPFFAASAGLARRMLMEAASDPATQVGRHPGDFALYKMGTFDNEAGTWGMHIPEFLCTALSLIQSRPQQEPLPLEQQAAN